MRRQIEVGPIDGERMTTYMMGEGPQPWLEVTCYMTIGFITVLVAIVTYIFWVA